MLRKIRTVACGISGGVDSAVAAHFLKRKGFEVIGVFMKNWDEVDEYGICTSDREFEDAKLVCEKLKIPLHHVNFVKEYWNSVFSSFLNDYQEGLTPNPDILCNKYIKFDIFLKHCLDILKVDAVATGHYAKTSAGMDLESADLSKGIKLMVPQDKLKDQTFFLSQIPQKALHRTMFPLQDIKKTQVKEIARSIGLEKIASKKESMGVCYIGKRNFQSFIKNYIEPKPGEFVDIETGTVLGKHDGIHLWTLGQRARLKYVTIKRFKKCLPWFVQSIDPETGTIYLAEGTDHPALFASSFYTSSPYWILNPPEGYEEKGVADVDFRFQHIHILTRSVVEREADGNLLCTLSNPYRSLSPGQYAVFYQGEEVLGSAKITKCGPSFYHQNMTERIHFRPHLS